MISMEDMQSVQDKELYLSFSQLTIQHLAQNFSLTGNQLPLLERLSPLILTKYCQRQLELQISSMVIQEQILCQDVVLYAGTLSKAHRQ